MKTTEEATTLLYSVRAKPGKQEETSELLRGLVTVSRSEPGNISYEAYQTAHDERSFFVYSVWTKKDALDAHHARQEVVEAAASFNELAEGDFDAGMNLLRKIRPS